MKPIIRNFEGANKLETAYGQHLALMKRAGEILDFRYEAMKLRLANKTFYTPDFMVISKDFIEFHETKGWMRDDAAVNLKVAATRFPCFKFILVMKEGKGFRFKYIEPET